MSVEQTKSVEEAIEAVLAEDVQPENVENAEAVEATIEPELVEEAVEQVNMIEALTKKLVLAEEEINTQKDLVIRAQAYAQNEIRKAGLDADSNIKRTLKRFTEALLPVVDSLEMAITHTDQEDESLKAMVEGVELTLKSMIDAFAKIGIVQINPVGEQANPEKHQIVSQQKVEGKEANEIIVVMQKGYEYNGQVIRPAMVMVATA